MQYVQPGKPYIHFHDENLVVVGDANGDPAAGPVRGQPGHLERPGRGAESGEGTGKGEGGGRGEVSRWGDGGAEKVVVQLRHASKTWIPL